MWRVLLPILLLLTETSATGHELDPLATKDQDIVILADDEKDDKKDDKGEGGDDDDEEECGNKMPKDSSGWFTLLNKGEGKDTFFLCLKEVKDQWEMLSAWLVYNNKDSTPTQVTTGTWGVGVFKNAPQQIPAASQSATSTGKKFMFVQKIKGSGGNPGTVVHRLMTYASDGQWQNEPEKDVLLSCKCNWAEADKCKTATDAAQQPAQCRLWEVDEKDTPCDEDEQDKGKDDAAKDAMKAKCQQRVSDVVYAMGDAQFGFDKNSRWWTPGKDDKDEDEEFEGESAAYCAFGDRMGDDIDLNSPQFANVAGLTDENLRSTQCFMSACEDAEGNIMGAKYFFLYYCYFDMASFSAGLIVLFFLLFWFVLMGVLADGYLVPALVRIGRGLNMSDALLGATLLALGGAANDFMTGLVSALANAKKANKMEEGDEPDLSEVKIWLGGVFGTGFFVNTLVAALVMVFAGPTGIPVIQSVITRDISFRIIAVSMMICFGLYGYINWVGALLMFLMYVIYVAITLSDSKSIAAAASEQGRRSSRASRSSIASFASEGKLADALPDSNQNDAANSFAGAETVQDRAWRHMGWEPDMGFMEKLGFVVGLPFRPLFALTMSVNKWDPVINSLLPFTMGIWIPYGSWDLTETILESQEWTEEELAALWGKQIIFFPVAGLICSGLVFFFSRRAGGQARAQDMSGVPVISPTYVAPMTFAWMTFLTSILWISVVANEVVDALKCMGKILDVPDDVMGITALAWGNCIDNVFATVGLAKAGEFGVAITGIYAAPMFNVLAGNGAILALQSMMKLNGISKGWNEFVMSLAAKIILFTLLGILVGTLVYTKNSGWRMTKQLGVMLGLSYPIVLIAAFAIAGTKED